jgi:hypothetical protein
LKVQIYPIENSHACLDPEHLIPVGVNSLDAQIENIEGIELEVNFGHVGGKD